MTRRRWLPLLALIASLPVAAPARAALADWKGHLGLGYGKLFVAQAPSGGFSIGAGMDYPLGKIRVGLDLGYHLLGTRSLTSGSLSANLDYSVFELGLLAHWSPAPAGSFPG